MSNIVVFDTETTSVNKPFCYNIGYCIVDVEAEKMLVKRDYVVEQVWHNPMLFTTAYYAEKREKYVKAMHSRKTEMSKYGYICRAQNKRHSGGCHCDNRHRPAFICDHLCAVPFLYAVS